MRQGINTDAFGVLSQIQPDGSYEGGDSANWNGHYAFLEPNSNSLCATITMLFFEAKPGAYVRHPDPRSTNNAFGAHYKNPWNGCMSRDQLTGVIAGLIASGDRGAKLRFVRHQALSLFTFAYNNIKNGEDVLRSRWKLPDLTLFDVWACELRMFPMLALLLYPLLCVLDLHNLIGCMIMSFKGDEDIISLLIKHIISYEIVPTPVSFLARKFLLLGDIQYKLNEYWSGWRKQPGMVELYMRRLR